MQLIKRANKLFQKTNNNIFKYSFSSTKYSDLVAQDNEKEIPVHMKPYDKAKYEVPSTKIKYATGYALLDVEPMPRAKIMKICYNVLDLLKDTPAESMYRIYTEEKIKYIMKLTDEIEDIRRLEEELGHESIELFIQSLSKEIDLVDYMKDSKPWEARDEELEPFKMAKIKRKEFKHDKLVRPERPNQKFIE